MINPSDICINTLPSIPLKYAQSLPPVPALYFCVSGAELLYIGITGNLNTRWCSHHKTIQLVSFVHVEIHWLAMSTTGCANAVEDVSLALEREFIHHWEPL